jgi:hypothetical protein
MSAFNWVNERHNCSLGAVFEQLKIEVQADVASRDALRLAGPETERYYGFKFKSDSRTFTVFVDGIPEISKLHYSVMFRLDSKSILVTREDGTNISATIGLNNEGRCIIKS